MAMKYNRDVAMRIFAVLEEYLPERFGKVREDDFFEDDSIVNMDEIEDKIWAIDHTVRFYSGISKLAIIAESLGEVAIKVPFNGYYDYSAEYYDYLHKNEDDYGDDDDEEEWDFDRKFSFEYFCGGGGKCNDDYCAEEYAAYKELKELGYEKFVAETELLGGINGMYILVQEFVTSMNDFDKEVLNSKKAIETSERIREDYCTANNVDDEWVAACVEHYGEELSEKFFNYTEEDGYAILADAHWGNYGYREDGSPCILDFSDYNG